jgi:hypothetical protein
MADAVIIDDGGSTRIKRQLPGNGIGQMDSLLDVNDLAGGARGSTHDVVDSFTNVLIVCQDKTGKPFSLSMALAAGIIVEVSSALNQRVTAVSDGARLTLTILSNVSDPIVEAKQHKKKRRYVVSNSGPIETVSVGGAVVYDVRAGGSIPAGAVRPIIYTSVVFT